MGQYWDREDRDFEREPTLGRRRRPVLNERGTVRAMFEDEPTRPLRAVESPWRPSDRSES